MVYVIAKNLFFLPAFILCAHNSKESILITIVNQVYDPVLKKNL